MKNPKPIYAPLVAALVLLGGYAGTSKAVPPMPTAGVAFSSDSRGGRTESSAPEEWNYTALPTPTPSEQPEHRLNEIGFADNSAELGREAVAICHQLAARIKSMKPVQILIIGFSHELELDPTLGQRRADVIRNILVGDGLERSTLETATFGSQFSGIDNSHHPYMLTAAQGVEIWTLED